MTTTNQCPECKGTLQNRTITHDVRFGETLYSFSDVPARVCDQCGTVYLDAAVLKQIEEVFKKQKEPERYTRVPVFSFTRLAT